MKTDMPHKELEQFMRDNIIRDKDYSTHLLYALYEVILKRPTNEEKFSVMSHTSFVKRIGEWSKPGMWLIKKGRGKNAIYCKRATHKSDIGFAELRVKANVIIECGLRRVMWWK